MIAEMVVFGFQGLKPRNIKAREKDARLKVNNAPVA